MTRTGHSALPRFGPVRPDLAMADPAIVETIRPQLLEGPTAARSAAAILWRAGMVTVSAPLAMLSYRRAA
jgi:hypothetical protein